MGGVCDDGDCGGVDGGDGVAAVAPGGCSWQLAQSLIVQGKSSDTFWLRAPGASSEQSAVQGAMHGSDSVVGYADGLGPTSAFGRERAAFGY